MKQVFTFAMIGAMLLSLNTFAQRYVKIDATTDYANPSDIFTVVMGDTTETGERVDENTIYQLENGGFYIISNKIVNKPNWELRIETTDLNDTDNKAVISRVPNDSGTYPNILYPEGNLTLKNLWIISGEKGPLADHDWGKIRMAGENARIILDDCLIEKDRGGFIQLRANNTKVYVNNCTFRNGGNRRILQGNGRIVDARDNAIDTLIVKNTLMYNIHDRILRSQGATAPHNYIEFDHNTIFNHFGRHGCFQFANANKIVVTNNFISNPIMQGTTPYFADEQTQVDSMSHKVFTIDSEDVDTDFTFSNNNIFWTDDVLEYYASNDTVSKVEVYSQEIIKKLGGEEAAKATYFSEALELNSVPQRILQLVKDTYDNPASTEMFDIIVEDISRQGTEFDSGNIFDFSTFDAGFDTATQSAKGSEGTYVGAVEVIRTGITTLGLNIADFSVYPNPSSSNVTIKYNMLNNGHAKMSVYDLAGNECMVLLDAFQEKGQGQVRINDLKSTLNSGVYFISLVSNSSRTTTKLVVL